jgi:hypothetical protein
VAAPSRGRCRAEDQSGRRGLRTTGQCPYSTCGAHVGGDRAPSLQAWASPTGASPGNVAPAEPGTVRASQSTRAESVVLGRAGSRFSDIRNLFPGVSSEEGCSVLAVSTGGANALAPCGLGLSNGVLPDVLGEGLAAANDQGRLGGRSSCQSCWQEPERRGCQPCFRQRFTRATRRRPHSQDPRATSMRSTQDHGHDPTRTRHRPSTSTP